MKAIATLRPRDPRLLQIACLGGLIAVGAATRGLDASPIGAAAALAGALGAQAAGARFFGVPFEARSAVVTTLSLTLLLRADAAAWMALAGAVAIGSKFLLRAGGKHLFNPANFALVALTFVSDEVWTTPGRWGTSVLFAAVFAGLGALVTTRAARLDAPLSFLGSYAALLFGRALWLGDPISVPMHAVQSGALIIFAFFMISDPKTTPDDRLARIGFCAGVAALGFWFQYGLFESDGIFYALFLACLARPVLEALRPASRYEWPAPLPEPIRIRP